jgi:beta-phosphoglucomutase
MTSPIRAALFDLDGTLVDNMRWHIDAWLETARALGRELTAERVMREFAGRRNAEIFPRLLERAVEGAELERLSEAKEARYRELFAPHLATVDGAAALLDDCAMAGIRVAVASAAPRANRDFVLDGLGLRARFAAIVGAEEVARGKPAPDLFLEAARRVGVAPHDAIVFEDAALGVTAARAAGMRAIGITTVEDAATLRDAGAFATAPTFAAMPADVRALFRAAAPKPR